MFSGRRWKVSFVWPICLSGGFKGCSRFVPGSSIIDVTIIEAFGQLLNVSFARGGVVELFPRFRCFGHHHSTTGRGSCAGVCGKLYHGTIGLHGVDRRLRVVQVSRRIHRDRT